MDLHTCVCLLKSKNLRKTEQLCSVQNFFGFHVTRLVYSCYSLVNSMCFFLNISAIKFVKVVNFKIQIIVCLELNIIS